MSTQSTAPALSVLAAGGEPGGTAVFPLLELRHLVSTLVDEAIQERFSAMSDTVELMRVRCGIAGAALAQLGDGFIFEDEESAASAV